MSASGKGAAVYLDYNATAKLRPEARTAMLQALDLGGNPSSAHADGRAARALVEAARADVGKLVGAGSQAVTFVSGGTEANALAIESAVVSGITRIIVGATEHDAVRANAQSTGVRVDVWPVDRDGVADLDWLETRLADGPRSLVCLMLANNETGVIQPIARAADLVRAAGGRLHADAVQAAGKIPVDFNALGVDSLALSAHKFGGPQGVGALVAGLDTALSRRLHGGGQERGRRAGTENVAGIAGFAAAARAASEDLRTSVDQSAWRDGLAAAVVAVGAEILGAGAARLPQTLCFATRGFGSEIQVMALDLAGIMVSAGAACSSGKVKSSHVIEAMGRGDLASSSIRISGGWASTAADWTLCGGAWLDAYQTKSARRREYA